MFQCCWKFPYFSINERFTWNVNKHESLILQTFICWFILNKWLPWEASSCKQSFITFKWPGNAALQILNQGLTAATWIESGETKLPNFNLNVCKVLRAGAPGSGTSRLIGSIRYQAAVQHSVIWFKKLVITWGQYLNHSEGEKLCVFRMLRVDRPGSLSTPLSCTFSSSSFFLIWTVKSC